LSGIVDITAGVLFLTGILSVKGGSSWSLFIICLIIGLIYLSAGIAIAMVRIKQRTKE
jgi:hypothetical protein